MEPIPVDVPIHGMEPQNSIAIGYNGLHDCSSMTAIGKNCLTNLIRGKNVTALDANCHAPENSQNLTLIGADCCVPEGHDNKNATYINGEKIFLKLGGKYIDIVPLLLHLMYSTSSTAYLESENEFT